MKLKFCKDCKWSKPDSPESWSNNCYHVFVVGENPRALANNDENGVDCQNERKRRSWFSNCGIHGKLWEPKNEVLK